MGRTPNEEIAERLDEIGSLLSAQGASGYRVRAYRRAADTLRRWPESCDDILRDRGVEGLRELPAVGESIARAIRDSLRKGRLGMLDRLRGEADPVKVLASVPGIGPRLADRLHHDFGIESLEDLEAAAHEGRLRHAGIGQKRLAGIRDSLAHRLARIGPVPARGFRPGRASRRFWTSIASTGKRLLPERS